ncbi:MAG: DUF4837 family protein [Bacteroidales bacterium]|jgi:hypothetical protein
MKARYSIYFLILLLVAACFDSDRPALQTSSSGAPGEVLLVMNEQLWNEEPGEAVRAILNVPYEGLPQDEPYYDILQINHRGFGKTFKTHRNIILTKIGPDQQEPKILINRDTWSKPQLLITILAPDEDAFIELVSSNGNKILTLLSGTEQKRLMKLYKNTRNEKLRQELEDDYSISLNVPGGYTMDVKKKDFIWISQEYRDIIQGILIYFYDYTDDETFTRDYLVEKRNRFLKEYVSGEVEGSYMTTEALYPPIFSEYKLNNDKYTAEIRGLWKMVNGIAMGGPFVSISQLDEKNNRVVTIEGFVFAPAHKKRELLKQVEAIILSLKILDKDSTAGQKTNG